MTSLGKLHANNRRRHPPAPLDPDEMLTSALSRARRTDFSDRSFVEPLRRLVRSYNTEAELSAFGRLSVRYDVLRCLKNLLTFDRIEESEPEILSRAIERPIFITGMPRSGTTFLHTLVAQDDRIAAPLSWQMFYPSRHSARAAAIRRVQVDLQLRIMEWLTPELDELHPLSANAPQECTDITAQVFQSLRFDSTFRVPAYQKWLDNHGHEAAYRFHRRFLQHLDAQGSGRRWILKSPDHVFALDAIRTVYPDALLVFLHRDPLSVLASVAKLTEVLRRPFSRSVDKTEIGHQVCSSWVDGADRMIAAAAQSENILHLHYRDVVSAPMEAVTKLYDHGGLHLSEHAAHRMRAWLERPPSGGNGQNRYSLREFGLDEESLKDGFGDYMERFQVTPEWDAAGNAPVRAYRIA